MTDHLGDVMCLRTLAISPMVSVAGPVRLAYCVGTGQCGSDRGRITIIGRRDVRPGQSWRLGRIAHHEAVINAELGKSACDPPSEATS